MIWRDAFLQKRRGKSGRGNREKFCGKFQVQVPIGTKITYQKKKRKKEKRKKERGKRKQGKWWMARNILNKNLENGWIHGWQIKMWTILIPYWWWSQCSPGLKFVGKMVWKQTDIYCRLHDITYKQLWSYLLLDSLCY